MDKSPDELKKEKEHLQEVLANLETSYRSAKITDKNYNEVKISSQKRIGEIDKLLSPGDAPEKAKASGGKEQKEENLAGDFTAETAASMKEEIDIKPEEKPKQEVNVEIEKMKVMIETSREEAKVIQESVRGVAESIGEVRSMAYQSEGLVKEMEAKLQKLQEDISGIKPSEISRKMKKLEESMEKVDIYDEKADAKFADLAKKTNLIYEMMKSAGGIENLSSLNREIGKKSDEVKEALHYIERMASKAEKAFLEINKNLEDFHVYKNRQDNLEEAMKEMIKSLDETNIKIESLSTKREFSDISGSMLLLKKQLEEISRVIPLIRVKLPEKIQNLTKEKDEVSAMLDLLEGQMKTGSISQGEYDNLKKANETKMRQISDQLEAEWGRFEHLAESGEMGAEPAESSHAEISSQPSAPKPQASETAPQPSAQGAKQELPEAKQDEQPAPEIPKKKRGRPKKSAAPAQQASETQKEPAAPDSMISEELKSMIDKAFENSEKTTEIKEAFESPSAKKLYENEKKPDEQKAAESAEKKPDEAKPDEIDSFVKDVAGKYLGGKEKEEFIKNVSEVSASQPVKPEEKKNEKKEKKGKSFEIAKNIKEMM